MSRKNHILEGRRITSTSIVSVFVESTRASIVRFAVPGFSNSNTFEPLLNMIPQTIPLNSESKMVEFYYVMLVRNLKTIDEIPQRYKILVEEKIKEGNINVK